jgi:hypothetical protein
MRNRGRPATFSLSEADRRAQNRYDAGLGGQAAPQKDPTVPQEAASEPSEAVTTRPASGHGCVAPAPDTPPSKGSARALPSSYGAVI